MKLGRHSISALLVAVKSTVVSAVISVNALAPAAWAAPLKLVNVTSDTAASSLYTLSAVVDDRDVIQRIEYRENNRLIHSFTPDEAKVGTGYVLMREQGLVSVVSLIVDPNFSQQDGGRVTLRVLRRFAPLNSVYKRFPLQVRRTAQGFTVFSDLADGLKDFDHLYIEALRERDPQPEGRIPGTGDRSTSAVGVKLLQLKRDGLVLDTINTAELR